MNEGTRCEKNTASFVTLGVGLQGIHWLSRRKTSTKRTENSHEPGLILQTVWIYWRTKQIRVVLFGCYMCFSMYCLCVNVYCHPVTTQLYVCVCVCIYTHTHTYTYILRGFKTSDDASRLSYSTAFDCSIRSFLDLFHSWLYIFHLSRFSGDGLVFPFLQVSSES